MDRPSRLIRFILLLVILTLLSVMVLLAVQRYMDARTPKEKIESTVAVRSYDDYFDPYTGEDKLQFIEFNLLSEPYAADDEQPGECFYLAIEEFEEASYLYIVCMSDEQFNNYEDIYEFTFSDEESLPVDTGVIYGYPAPIEDDLKALTIEYFDLFWGEGILTEDNFNDIVGTFYLDAAYQER